MTLTYTDQEIQIEPLSIYKIRAIRVHPWWDLLFGAKPPETLKF
jgi:hypothetical protein